MGGAADSNAIAALHAENARLIALLEAHGIEWRTSSAPTKSTEADPPRLTTAERVALFRRLFRGRTDVYPDGHIDLIQVHNATAVCSSACYIASKEIWFWPLD